MGRRLRTDNQEELLYGPKGVLAPRAALRATSVEPLLGLDNLVAGVGDHLMHAHHVHRRCICRGRKTRPLAAALLR